VLKARAIILATGARPRTLPGLPVDGRLVVTSREALEQKDLPRSAVIVGGGAIGCEFAYLYSVYGVKVTVVELLPRLLPLEDEEVGRELEKAFTKRGITVHTGSKVVETAKDEGSARLTVEASGGEKRQVEAERVLVAVGVQPNTEGLGLERLGVATERGFVAVDGDMATSVPGIYAIGDVTGKVLLAHVASAQGVAAVEKIAGKETPPLDYSLMPRAVYCQPQVASWGLTEAQAKEAGHKPKVGRFPFSANGKALALGEGEGFVKVVSDQGDGRLLGVHLVGPEVTELLAELSMTRYLEGTVSELGWLVHAHPSLSEALKEAALAAQGAAIHI
jgi:dihydrolipoamide dehydrogenase